ncbi:hypothetical protein ACFY2K_40915, partial [Kitasatospora sp. NPDC001309]|uniref:hypothetical protein n=1 Tax=Kitasatospora sp. NPDC001309 TaxID=3364013 RepID=UPI0036C82F01
MWVDEATSDLVIQDWKIDEDTETPNFPGKRRIRPLHSTPEAVTDRPRHPLNHPGRPRLPAAEYPLLRTLAPLLIDHDAETEFTTGLD